MHFIYLSFAIVSQLSPIGNLKALFMLQLPCCSCCLASFRDHAGFDHLKFSGGLGGSAYSHFGKQRHIWILHWLCEAGLWTPVSGNLGHQPQ